MVSCAVQDKAVSTSGQHRRGIAGKFVFVSDSAELDQRLCDAVLSLQQAGAHITFVIGKRGPLSAWLSQHHVYYFIYDVHLGNLYARPFLRAQKLGHQTSELIELYAHRNVSAVVNVDSSELCRQSAEAARCAGVAVCTITDTIASAEDFCRRLFEIGMSTSRARGRAWRASVLKPFVSFGFALSAGGAGLVRWMYRPLKRALDILGAAALLVVFWPVLLVLGATRVSHGLPFWQSVNVVGRLNKPVAIYTFATGSAPSANPLCWLPSLWSVLQGRLSFVGPRIQDVADARPATSGGVYLQLRPGIAAWSRLKDGVFVTESERNAMDEAYMLTVNPIVDLKILVAAILRGVRNP